jgi:hypothetical protein
VRARHVLAAGAALCALAGCGSAKPAASPTTAAPSVAPSASLDAGTLDATAAYLTGLGKLDPKLVADKPKALDNGAATCADIADHRPEAEQESNVASRYAVDPAQARKILDLARTQLCL